MKSLLPVRLLYAIAALYDGLLGLAFIVAAPQIFQLVAITPPNHWGYVHFAAGLLVIFGFMFLQIALRPVENRGLNHALIEGYHTALMKGRFPVCCLFLEINPAAVDVNIHPSKREVYRLEDLWNDAPRLKL